MGKNGGKKNGNRRALSDPSALKPFDADDKQLLQVVIETPKGSRNKYALDHDQGVFELKKVLPEGMNFPFDFGFVPSTGAGDGDPLDVLVLMDEPAFPGCLLKCRVVGIIEGEQSDAKSKVRNDRVIAVEQGNHAYSDISHIDELGERLLREIEAFFVNYHQLEGRKYRVLGRKGPEEARKMIKQAIA